MAYQSLYRRYRPQTFAEIRGQEHVVKALRNAVRDDRVGHAYLLSGPRGTGKTTAARILAKVLNCENPIDGEPDGTCASCLSIESGTSFDLHELDAASNNKVDDIRDLLSRVALGTPGRSKVYLLDEVHMLTPGAENALLKTLEEPPDHVTFVLATTEPHKVVSTIRSRTQHLELTLIPGDQMVELVQEIAADAGLDLTDEAIGHVVKVGGGSARDTLSALDQVVAAGGVTNVDTSTADLLEAVAAQEPGLALQAIEAATSRGVDPRRVGEGFVDALRSVFLVKMGAAPARMSEPERVLSDLFVPRLSPAVITRSMEAVGKSLVDMRQAPDPRIDLEVAFVRICSPSADASTAGLAQRVEQLEAALAAGSPLPTGAATSPPVQTSAAPSVEAAPMTEAPPAAEQTVRPAPVPAAGGKPADRARAALRPRTDTPPAAAPPPPATPSEPAPAPGRTSGPPPPPSARGAAPNHAPTPGEPPVQAPPAEEQTAQAVDTSALRPLEPASQAEPISAETIAAGWGAMLDGQSTPARARFLAGRVAAVEGNTIQFLLPSEGQIRRCEPYKGEVEAAIAESFGAPLTITLGVDTGQSPSPMTGRATPAPQTHAEPQQEDADIDLDDLTDADVGNASVVDRIADVFPGAEVLEEES